MEAGALGKEYADQEAICRQGEKGNCMYGMTISRISPNMR